MSKTLNVRSVTRSDLHAAIHAIPTSRPLGAAHALVIVLVPLLGVGSRELLPASLALVYWRVLRMRALVMAVTIV